MNIELLSKDNLEQLINLVLEFWDDCEFNEEYKAYEKIINSEEQVIFLGKDIRVIMLFFTRPYGKTM